MPQHFDMPQEDVRELLLHHGAGDLVTSTSQGLLATLLPGGVVQGLREDGEVVMARAVEAARHPQ